MPFRPFFWILFGLFAVLVFQATAFCLKTGSFKNTKKVSIFGSCWQKKKFSKSPKESVYSACNAPDEVLRSSLCEIEALRRSSDVLNLSMDQKQKILQDYKKFKRKSRYYKSKMDLLMLELNEVVLEDTLDMETVRKDINGLRNFCNKLLLLHASTVIHFREILNEKQRSMLKRPIFPRDIVVKSVPSPRVVPCGGD